MYAKYSGIVKTTWSKFEVLDANDTLINKRSSNGRSQELKPYHHVRLDSEFKFDCQVWLQFLNNSPLKSVVSRPMIDVLRHEKTSTEISFYSNASGNKTLSFGCLMGTKWIAD